MANRIHYVYLTTNKINNKTYVGQRKCPLDKTPFNDYNYLGSGKQILKSIEKYGAENFTKEVLAICNSKEIVNVLEIEYIALYRSIGKAEYNMADGGYSFQSDYWNFKSEKELNIIREKIREARKHQEPMNENSRNKLKKSLSEYWNSAEGAEMKKQLSEKQKNKHNTKNKHWYNNGKINVVAFTCPIGFVEGRLKN